MKLAVKVEGSLAVIREALVGSSRPAVMSSFGKDSMVMLDLLKKLGVKLPVLFFKEPSHPLKYRFANQVIEQEGYTVYDYPPVFTQVAASDNALEVINYHQGGDLFLYVPTGTCPPKVGEPYLCGLNDLYLKPTGSFAFRWDLLLIGHKSSDVDPIFNAMPLKSAIKPGRPTLAFPLHDFTDKDVWAYHEEFNLPVNEHRYARENNFKERADYTFNPDYFPACTACIDPRELPTVYCPKAQRVVENLAVAGKIDLAPLVRPSYFAEV